MAATPAILALESRAAIQTNRTFIWRQVGRLVGAQRATLEGYLLTKFLRRFGIDVREKTID